MRTYKIRQIGYNEFGVTVPKHYGKDKLNKKVIFKPTEDGFKFIFLD